MSPLAHYESSTDLLAAFISIRYRLCATSSSRPVLIRKIKEEEEEEDEEGGGGGGGEEEEVEE